MLPLSGSQACVSCAVCRVRRYRLLFDILSARALPHMIHRLFTGFKYASGEVDCLVLLFHPCIACPA